MFVLTASRHRTEDVRGSGAKALASRPLPHGPRSSLTPSSELQACSPCPGTSSISSLEAWAHGWLKKCLHFSSFWKK